MGGIVKGGPNQDQHEDMHQKPATVEPVRVQQQGLSVLAHQFVQKIGDDAVEANSTRLAINATGHAAWKGDVIAFTSGNLNTLEVKVLKVETNVIYVAEELPEAPAETDTFEILRHKYPRVNANGSVITVAET